MFKNTFKEVLLHAPCPGFWQKISYNINIRNWHRMQAQCITERGIASTQSHKYCTYTHKKNEERTPAFCQGGIDTPDGLALLETCSTDVAAADPSYKHHF